LEKSAAGLRTLFDENTTQRSVSGVHSAFPRTVEIVIVTSEQH